MPLQSQPVEIMIDGLSQHVDEKVKPHGSLERADNAEFDKAGALNKRRGYRKIVLAGADINGITPPELYSAAVAFRDELLLLSDHVFAVVSPLDAVDETSVVRRGPLPRGAFRLRAIVGDGIGDSTR